MPHPYQEPSRSIEERASDLLSRMTFEEKAAQMTCIWQGKATRLLDEHGIFNLKKARAAFKTGHGIGQAIHLVFGRNALVTKDFDIDELRHRREQVAS